MLELVAGEPVQLGKQGENVSTVIKFPVQGWAETYGEGTFALRVRRPGETETYNLSLDSTTYPGYAAWIVREYDVQYDGWGECEILYTVNDTLAKSETYATRIERSLEGVRRLKMLRIEHGASDGEMEFLTIYGHDDEVTAYENNRMATGSWGIATDTKDVYIYDEEDGWSDFLEGS